MTQHAQPLPLHSAHVFQPTATASSQAHSLDSSRPQLPEPPPPGAGASDPSAKPLSQNPSPRVNTLVRTQPQTMLQQHTRGHLNTVARRWTGAAAGDAVLPPNKVLPTANLRITQVSSDHHFPQGLGGRQRGQTMGSRKPHRGMTLQPWGHTVPPLRKGPR